MKEKMVQKIKNWGGGQVHLIKDFSFPHGGKYPLGVVIFQDGCPSKELISISKTNG